MGRTDVTHPSGKQRRIMTPEEINAEYKKSFIEDPNRREFHAELARARFVLLAHPTENSVTILQRNLVANSVITELTGSIPSVERRERRADKYAKLIDWCKTNHLVQATANEIADVGGLSYPTALKFIGDRPDLFYKIKRGLYEIRNPEIIRQQEKEESGK